MNVADIHPGRLTLLEALDIADASGVDADDFVAVMERGTLRQKAYLMYAMAWVVARRLEPELTFEEVKTYRLVVKGTAPERSSKRAETLAATAALAGISTREAEKMTIEEVAATVQLHKRRASTSRRRKKVG